MFQAKNASWTEIAIILEQIIKKHAWMEENATPMKMAIQHVIAKIRIFMVNIAKMYILAIQWKEHVVIGNAENQKIQKIPEATPVITLKYKLFTTENTFKLAYVLGIYRLQFATQDNLGKRLKLLG